MILIAGPRDRWLILALGPGEYCVWDQALQLALFAWMARRAGAHWPPVRHVARGSGGGCQVPVASSVSACRKIRCSRVVTAPPVSAPRRQRLPDLVQLHLRLLSYLESIIDLDAKVTDRALQLGMTEQ